jgi:hypothetical protein
LILRRRTKDPAEKFELTCEIGSVDEYIKELSRWIDFNREVMNDAGAGDARVSNRVLARNESRDTGEEGRGDEVVEQDTFA